MNKLEEQRLLHKLFIIALLGFDINYVNKYSLGFYLKSDMVDAVIGLFPEDEAVSTLYFRESLEKERRYIESYEAVTNKIIEK